MAAMIHYLWLIFGSSIFTATAPSYPEEQLHNLGGITSAKDGSALKTRAAAGPWGGGNSGSANVLVDSGALGHSCDDALIPGPWLNSPTIKYWLHCVKPPSPGGTNWMRLCYDCSAVTSSVATERSI